MRNLRQLSIAITALMLTAPAGCIRDGLSDCGGASFTFTVKAYDTDRATELTRSSVKDVAVYVFDRNDLFVKEIRTNLGETVKIPSNAGDIVKVVAWGNLGGGNQNRPVLKAGDHISAGAVELMASRAGTGHQTPDDLFMGTALFVKGAGASEHTVFIYRKTGSIEVTIEGFRKYYSVADDNVSIVVQTTCGVIPFSGSSPQSEVSYRLGGAFDSAGEFRAGPVALFAANDITIEIFLNGVPVAKNISTATAPINVCEGMTTNVHYKFWTPAMIDWEISIIPWEKEEIRKDYR